MTLESFSQSHFQISPKPPYADGYLYRLTSSPVRSAVERVRQLLLHLYVKIKCMLRYDVQFSSPGNMTPCIVTALTVVVSHRRYVLHIAL